MKRKIEAMQQEYGITQAAYCKTCCNLFRGSYHGTTYRKCIAYGVSHGAATDWNVSYRACGLHNKPYETSELKPLKDTLKYIKEVEVEVMEGQMML